MKKKNILLITTSVLVLFGCNNEGSNLSSSLNSSVDSSNGSFNSLVDDSSASSSSSSSSTPITPEEALKMFEQALKKDYSNLTLMSYQQYFDGEMSELDYEFVDDGYIVDYAYSLREMGMGDEYCYSYYYDDNGTSYTYWEADKDIKNSKGGWLNKGYHNADLSIWNAYFYLPKLLDNITINDVAYQQGLYYIKDIAKVEELNLEAFGYAWNNEIIDICFTLDENNYINKIYGFCDKDSLDPKNYVLITISDFGNTTLPNMQNIPTFSENTKTTYWQYKGWPHDYVDAYYDNISISLAPNQNLESDDTHNVIVDLDKTFTIDLELSPETFEDWELLHEEDSIVTWHYDEKLLEQKSTKASNQSLFRAIAPGETEIYATVNSKDGTLESERIKVKVKEAAVQDKTGAVYDFTWASIDENHKVIAQNNTESKALYDITAGPGVSLVNGKNSDLFTKDSQYILIDPLSQDVLNNPLSPGLYFDFGEQQVSKISFNYGLFYANHKSNLQKLSSVKIRTSNDGITYEEIDITNEIKENISADFTKLFEIEFAPASKVELIMKGTTVGNSLAVALDSLCFIANDECHDYVSPDENINVESVTISPSSVEMFVEDTTTLVGTVLPQNATDKSLVWHIQEGEDCVSLDNGQLTALKAGSAVVYATSADGKIVSNYVNVTVKEKPSFSNYLNCSYKEEEGDWLVEVLTESSARISNGSISIEASITDFKNDVYTLKNANGESFCLAWTNSRVDITQIKYLRNGELAEEGGTKYCYLRIFMNDFTVKVGNLTPNIDGKYEVLVGEEVYLSLLDASPSNANVKDVTYSSSDTSKAAIEESSNEAIKLVTFVGEGEVTITVSDAHNPSLTKEIVFVISARTYPTDNNWSLTSSKDVVEVGEQVNFSVEFDPSINTDTTVTYSVDNEDLASISQRGVLTAKAEGTVVVTASVNTENGVSTKTITITINPAAEGAVPGEVRGTWFGTDDNGTAFTFTIDSNGATFEYTDYDNNKIVYTFGYVGIESGDYVFQCNENSSIRVSIYLSSSSYGTFTLTDPEAIINDYSSFAIYSDYLSIEK